MKPAPTQKETFIGIAEADLLEHWQAAAEGFTDFLYALYQAGVSPHAAMPMADQYRNAFLREWLDAASPRLREKAAASGLSVALADSVLSAWVEAAAAWPETTRS